MLPRLTLPWLWGKRRVVALRLIVLNGQCRQSGASNVLGILGIWGIWRMRGARSARKLRGLPSLRELGGLRGLPSLRGLGGLTSLRKLAPRATRIMALNALPACGAAEFAGKSGFHGQRPLHTPSDGLRRFSAEGFQLLFKTLTHRHKASAVTVFVSQKNQFPFGDGLVGGQRQVPVVFHKVRHGWQAQMAK